MIPIEKLRSCKRLITHAYSDTVACPDGLASAMIIRAALPEIEVVFCVHNSDVHLGMEARPGDIWCDFTPHVDNVADHVAAGSIVLDHHKSARDVVAQFEHGIFADEVNDPGVSGATLAEREIYNPMFSERDMTVADPGSDRAYRSWIRSNAFATRAGIRDTWQRNHPDWLDSCAQQEALVFFGAENMLSKRVPYLSDEDMAVGRALFSRKQSSADKAARRAYRMGDFLVVEGTSLISDVCEAVRMLKLPEHQGAEVVIGFDYQMEPNDVSIKFSMRSLGDVDVEQIAKCHGGGGHSKAAGFTARSVHLKWGLYPSPFAYLLAANMANKLGGVRFVWRRPGNVSDIDGVAIRKAMLKSFTGPDDSEKSQEAADGNHEAMPPFHTCHLCKRPYTDALFSCLAPHPKMHKSHLQIRICSCGANLYADRVEG